MIPLVAKLLRDVLTPLLVVMILFAGFEALWVKVTQRTTTRLSPIFMVLLNRASVQQKEFEDAIFQGPGKLLQTLSGGEDIRFERTMDMLSIGYIHPLIQTILCIWAVNRGASVVAAELDKGTMELLAAQPIPRSSVVAAHFAVDVLTIPLLVGAMLAGTWFGIWLVGPFELDRAELEKLPLLLRPTKIDESMLAIRREAFAPALWSVAGLVFAVTGFTAALSAFGRFRNAVLAQSTFVVLLMFLLNVLGQLWEPLTPLRPLTFFYWYQPQSVILHNKWAMELGLVWNGGSPLVTVPNLLVLYGVGLVGYLVAAWQFGRRDLPAPL